MKVEEYLHDWNVSYDRAREIQNGLGAKLILHDEDLPDKIKTIAGADISYSRNSNIFFAVVVILDFPTMGIIEQASFSEMVDFPYIPGLLTFREGYRHNSVKLQGLPAAGTHKEGTLGR